MRIYQQQKIDKYFGYFLIILLFPVTRLLGILLKRNHKLSSPPANILCIKILGLGSLILATDALKSIKQKYPEARLILITDINIANGIASFDLFDEVWTIRSGNISSVIKGSLIYLFKSWKLKKLWIVDLEVYSKLTTIYALMTFAVNRFGFYLTPVFFRKYLNTHNVFFNQYTFLEDNYNSMATAITGNVNIPENIAPVRKSESLKPFIAFNNTCSDLAWVRKLPDDHFAQICKWILENTPYKIALLGAPNDRKVLSDFIEQQLSPLKNRIINFAETPDFTSYYRFIEEECVCLISIDSAPVHIAKKLGVPTLSIWGPTNPANYLKIPAGEKGLHLFHYQQVACSPCIHHFEKLPCNGNNFCMKNVEVNSITEKISVLLQNIRTTD